MESVYLETTFVSYLVALPSRDVIVAGHQQATQNWWANRRHNFQCLVSQFVIDEASAGNCKHLANAQIARRIAVVCANSNYEMPIICTPDELMGS